MMYTTFWITSVFCLVTVSSEFNKHFANFIEENYGKNVLNTLQRIDLGDNGSFGGKIDSEEQIINDPVIFVHGVSDLAGGKMQSLAAQYKKHGYTAGELYATTYDNGSKNNPFSWTEYSLKCDHVKQIRTLILAVRYYTLRDVDVVSYSFGVPIARKAILGGRCVDTKEDIGPSLTSHVDTFVGIAGPNHGISLQIGGLSFPGCLIGAIPILPICSKTIGLYSGFCPTKSSFLTNINEESHYEGKHVYSLYTVTDGWIGYKICDEVTGQIPGEDGHKQYNNYSHEDVIFKSHSMQIHMIQHHSLTKPISKTIETIDKKSISLADRSFDFKKPHRYVHQQPTKNVYSRKSFTDILKTASVEKKITTSSLPPVIMNEMFLSGMTTQGSNEKSKPAEEYAQDEFTGYHTHVKVSFE